MKINDIINEQVKTNILEWNENPKIGWVAENRTITLYYGAKKEDFYNMLNEGIFADKSGYVEYALEPYTAWAQSKSKYRDNNVVVVCEFTKEQQKEMLEMLSEGIQVVSDRISHELYENWNKSDVEFYALSEVYVPVCIPSYCIKGYMVK